MAIGFSAEELKRRLQRVPLIPGNITQKITRAATGQTSVSASHAKRVIPKILKNQSQIGREKIYNKWGLNYDEKKRLEKIVAGGKTAEQIRKEKERYDILKKRNVAWARFGRDSESIGGGPAQKLIFGRAYKTDKSAEKREQEARERVETKAGSKITHEHLGIRDVEREKSAISAKQGEISVKDKNAAQRTSISQAGEAAIGVTGVGDARGKLGDKASGKVSDLNNFRNSKPGGRDNFSDFRKAA